MPYDPHETQKRQKREHRDLILKLLMEQRRTFSQLQKATGFSPMGLSKMLEDLKQDGKVVKSDPKNKKSPYNLKGHGIRAKEFLFPGPAINELRDSGKFYVDLPNHMESEIFNFGSAFGITSYVLYDKKIRKQYRPFWKKEMFEIEKYLYDKIFTKHHHGSLPIDESIKGKIFVILEIDYNEMAMIIKNRTEQENEKLVKDKLLELKLNP